MTVTATTVSTVNECSLSRSRTSDLWRLFWRRSSDGQLSISSEFTLYSNCYLLLGFPNAHHLETKWNQSSHVQVFNMCVQCSDLWLAEKSWVLFKVQWQTFPFEICNHPWHHFLIKWLSSLYQGHIQSLVNFVKFWEKVNKNMTIWFRNLQRHCMKPDLEVFFFHNFVSLLDFRVLLLLSCNERKYLSFTFSRHITD